MIPFTVSKLAIAVISPLGTALALGVIGLLVQRRARRAGAMLIALGLAWLWFWSVPAVSDPFVHRMESRYPAQPVDTLPRADAIVVLGGAVEPPAPGSLYPNLTQAADRMWHAARVFRAGKAPFVLASGGSDPEVAAVPESQSIAQMLVDLGVPAGAIVQERDSRTTRENALMSAPLLRARQVRTILLVTSALHMRRAVTEFEQVGLTVIPVPTDHSQPHPSGLLAWVPQTEALDASGRSMKELVGDWVARRR